MHERFGYAYDKAWNLNTRTNNALIQNFGVNSLNELTTSTHSGTLTVAGSTTEGGGYVSSVTVNGSSATEYADGSFAATGFTPVSGANSYTASATDTYGRTSTSSTTVILPSTTTNSYDSNGNLLSDGTRCFNYDDENQLISVWVTNLWRSDYVYDGLNRRRIVKDYGWTGSAWQVTNEVHYIYDRFQVLQERDTNDQPLVTYTRGVDVSGTLEDAGGIGGLLARTDNKQWIAGLSTAHNYYFFDGNGNVAALVSTNGVPVAQYAYDPFGNILTMSGPLAYVNTYRFSSKEWNNNSGLYYFGDRFYDPLCQRWPNRDPFGEYGGLNLYDYVYNDPLGMLDPYGLALFGLYDSWGDYFNDVGNTFAGEAKGAGSELSFGLYKPCYQNSLQRQGGYVGQGLAMAGETLGGGLGGWRAAGDAAKGLEYSHWVPARALPGGRGGLLDDLTKAAKLNGNYVSKADHALSDPSRYQLMPKAWKAANPLPDPLTQQLNRLPLFPTGLAAGAGAAAAGAAASSGSGGGCH